MPVTPSPLRYPGGKSQLEKFLGELIDKNNLEDVTYIEPFAGGAGLALSLLYSKKVNKIIINDFDPAIWSIWKSILSYPDEFIRLIENIPITIEEWHNQKQTYLDYKINGYAPTTKTDILNFAISTFFLNRTNRSGIIKGGVIGGLKQEAKDKLDCRFNKSKLIAKVNLIHSYSNCIELYNLDALIFTQEVIQKKSYNNTLVFFDPPYYKKGPNLYSNFYFHSDHENLSKLIQSSNLKCHWITTYDACDEIKKLYSFSNGIEYSLNYSLAIKRKASELMYFSNSLKENHDYNFLKIIKQFKKTSIFNG